MRRLLPAPCLPLGQRKFKRFCTIAPLCAALLLSLCLSTTPQTAHAQKQGSPQAAQKRDTVKLLHIGNSFSMNATRHLPQLAQAGGKEILIFDAAIGGSSLERHARHLKEAKAGEKGGEAYANNAEVLGTAADAAAAAREKVTLPEALAAQPWDVITIQQVSSQSYKPETQEPHAGELIAEIREKAPQAQIYVHQTWAYRPDHLLFETQTDLDAAKMHQALSAAYKQLAERYGLEIIPAGNAVYTAAQLPQWQHHKDPNYNYKAPKRPQRPEEGGLFSGPRWRTRRGKANLELDGKHLNSVGEYLAACVWYEMLFTDSVLDTASYTPKGLTPAQAAELRSIAHETVAAYRKNGL